MEPPTIVLLVVGYAVMGGFVGGAVERWDDAFSPLAAILWPLVLPFIVGTFIAGKVLDWIDR